MNSGYLHLKNQPTLMLALKREKFQICEYTKVSNRIRMFKLLSFWVHIKHTHRNRLPCKTCIYCTMCTFQIRNYLSFKENSYLQYKHN